MDKNDVIKVSRNILRVTNPLSYALLEGTEAILDSQKAKKDAPLEELRIDAERLKIELSKMVAVAKVAQEEAIANRIMNAEEVQIKEYYDLSGQGTIGATVGSGTISAGIGASGSKVSKRVYTFKGMLNNSSSDNEK